MSGAQKMDAEKALIAAHGMTAYAWKPGLCGGGCPICALARAAFEAGREYERTGYRSADVMQAKAYPEYDPLPKWLTETSR